MKRVPRTGAVNRSPGMAVQVVDVCWDLLPEYQNLEKRTEFSVSVQARPKVSIPHACISEPDENTYDCSPRQVDYRSIATQTIL